MPAANVVDLFQPMEHEYSGGRYESEVFPYRLFIPEPMREEESYPLIVWLHGFGDGALFGHVNSGQLTHLESTIFKNPDEKSAYPFFLLATQCPPDQPYWFEHTDIAPQPGSASGDEMLTVLLDILNKTIRSYPIDPARVTLVGISSGADGAWEFVLREPQRFAGLALLGFQHGSMTRPHMQRIAQVPIRAFHRRYDKKVPVTAIRTIVAELQSVGADAQLTETEGHPSSTESHDCWREAFNKFALLDWLLSQRKDSVNRTTPLADSTSSVGETTLLILKVISPILLFIAICWLYFQTPSPSS